ncbi:3-deoxy-8-phosphooctulonate synthase [Ornithobacterium rhinotracheale]|uniref:3-deoxy-8-phosphooctulonate synthase n=1 Tax=Ornithobacterium rhinotracheale (strain ATCC 51463 / DSM 15997 / CCUG 23171 / CIP 104009 / LMG 9086) TaxID=867902 RepID=I3ZXI9_ORNRL|nr:3-deoxy-8-phosphooctulonate synthase [Ornithobacterium rhinotracheale]AFL96423.1 3-deoxy-8-phosphooctulonate synthase [Ornithobacterium rhinotracheale DSM 15997]AIP98636.1 2-dehydro-3-deoxyphosphogluconate aldolase [Ornithobacterium rhinotracheale ORT-UMN 88]KGB67634.1 2-dehydro-3-deoxyphosphogluconate aldolase [Ornithobacterium rhinotracheale H06-030791]MBN3662152.1 3-deoxy-8-phosphooctulonate synthase [Ornithobacterium rhinotracheale]MCK0194751.1 3-deoxy-8-phosphooctulonate synthase [Orni
MIQNLPKIQFTDSGNFFLIAGPCAIENEETPFAIAEELVKITNDLKIPFVFKGSFRKANRSRIDSFTGIGDEKALKIIQKIGETFNVPTTTDIHESSDAALAAKYVDVLQIPAFLVRQTDLVVAAAKTGKAVTLKKGQFLSPESMQFPVQKVTDSGNQNVAIIERGTTFGYQDLVVDFRGIPVMQQYAPVILDITHSLQQPNQSNGVTGGKPALIETIAKAGIATGVDGIFIETHPNPSQAKSDGANMLPLNQMRDLLEKLIKIRAAINS